VSNHRLEEGREDGLAVCLTCGGAEASLPTDCPGRRMTAEEQDDVQAGVRDYRGGGWDGPGWYWWGSEGCRGPYPSRSAAWKSYDQHTAPSYKR
jgi:hypothetical protein